MRALPPLHQLYKLACFCYNNRLKMPKVGIDPTTKSLKDFRSTTELLRRIPDMGFEPMRANTLRLECSSLDLSDNPVHSTASQGYTVLYLMIIRS